MDVTDGVRPRVARPAVRTVDIDQGDGINGIDDAVIDLLHAALDAGQADPECRILLLTAAPGVFCTGMNLVAAGRFGDEEAVRRTSGAFYDLLLRFTSAPLIVACAVDGRVAGGGIGLVAAADLVFASETSTFALPEALWGLLPCCVLPFLMRRIGFQRAYSMTLTTRPIGAVEAAACGLADEIGADLTAMGRRLALRADKLDPSTIADLKGYAHALWPLSGGTRDLALDELGRLMGLPEVRERLSAFAENGTYPWER